MTTSPRSGASNGLGPGSLNLLNPLLLRHWVQDIVSCKQRLIRHCLLNKIVYSDIIYVIATRSYIYAKSHWKYHTFKGYYICSSSKLRHKAHQKVRKCGITFPLRNGIVTFYEN